MLEEQILKLVEQHANAKVEPEEWNWEAFSADIFHSFAFTIRQEDFDDYTPNAIAQVIYDRAKTNFEGRQRQMGPELIEMLARWLMLTSLDNQWKDHLLSMDRLKDGIGLRGYAQKDPLREYQREGFDMFGEMMGRVRSESVSRICHVQIQGEEDVDELAPKDNDQPMYLSHGAKEAADGPPKARPVTREEPKVGRNDLCPCGSGKKYKQCCGSKSAEIRASPRSLPTWSPISD